eukprot:TRINITY_DN22191_c0_g1_i1.p1 TRINITY_DN22191_c0_g1~~TRINITY_DN22191_c0_g1_i1.p1  ORF type:complete len:1215 (-),score=130.86 TRINITY_DN22191_c0_g1_i1:761-4405(-)
MYPPRRLHGLFALITIVIQATDGEERYVGVGDNTILDCDEAKHQPGITSVEWFCRSCSSLGTVKDSRVAVYTPELGATPLIHPSRIRLESPSYSLYISALETGDTGTWYCRVDGRNKPISAYHLKVTDVPSTPGKPLVMSFSSRTVKLSWAPPLDVHSSPIREYVIRVRNGEDTDWTDSETVPTDNNSTVYSVIGLKPFNVYSFRVSAVNGVGQSPESEESYYMITLREVPSGKPTITSAHNTSSDSIYLAWEPPHPSTLHGEFLGYQLSYRSRDAEKSNVTKIKIKGPNVSQYTIKNLSVFTQYLVSLEVVNPEGYGPATTVVVMTDEGVPSAPLNVSTHSITNSSVVVTWLEPSRPNGIIEGYRLYFMHSNFTDVRTIKETNTVMEYQLQGLESYMSYRLWLKAFTWKNEGSPSQQLSLMTDVSGPASPLITNLTCEDARTLHLEWVSPRSQDRLSFYTVYYAHGDEIQTVEMEVKNTTGNTNMIQLENLTTNQMYSVRIQGSSESIYSPGLMYRGRWSETHQILLQKDCHLVQAITLGHSRKMALNLNAGVIAGLGATVLLFALGLLFTALWRRYFTESYYYLEDKTSDTSKISLPDWDVESGKQRVAIPVDVFLNHVTNLHCEGDEGFSREFEKMTLSREKQFPTVVASLPNNREKNRYNNVLPYDHSLVQLRPLPGSRRPEYINASFIDGFQKSRAYIGTQGPLLNTIPCFWRMVWEQRVNVIVMITNLVEQGKKKCDQYWPEGGSEIYGMIDVLLQQEEVQANFTVRTFRLRHLKLSKKDKSLVREVVQYQYTSWPDHGTPLNILPVLSFIKKSSSACQENDGPLVVHCSAGVGRTGTYIVIDAMLKQLRAKGEINIMSFLSHIRHQRSFLVQTEDQYIFIHDTLAEAVASGETNIKTSYLTRYINSLQSNFTTEDSTWQLLQRQYNQITSKKPLETHFSTATMPCNQLKNQSFDFLPIDSTRTKLPILKEIEGSDYINASWIPGFHGLTEFILTQHPKEQTTLDFWRLIWEQDVHTVVVLSNINDPDYPVFWPEDEQMRISQFTVKHTEEGLLSGFQTKDFRLECGESTPRVVRMVFCPDWSCSLSTKIEQNNISLLPVIHARQDNLPPRPLLVLDKDGGPEAATFCALSSLIRQVHYDHSVDIYLTAKTIHNSRPGIWNAPESILYLYKAIELYSSSINKGARHPPEGREDKKMTLEVSISRKSQY